MTVCQSELQELVAIGFDCKVLDRRHTRNRLLEWHSTLALLIAIVRWVAGVRSRLSIKLAGLQ